MEKLLLLLPLILMGACSGTDKNSSRLEVSISAAIAGKSYGGGAMARLSNASGKVLDFDLGSTHVISVPHGTWTVSIVGFDGAQPWAGPYECGEKQNVNFYLPEQSVTISVSTANCSVEPYTSMIATKTQSRWGYAQWDVARWGP